MVHKSWGGRFNKSVNTMVAKFNESLSFDHILYEEDITGSEIHAKMLAKQGLISEKEAEQICAGLNEIRSELQDGAHYFDIEYEDIHMFIEHLLIQKIGDVGKKLHTGRSRNDQVALDLRLYMKKAVNQIENNLKQVTNTLQTLAETHEQDMMPGYTHLQQAQPISLGKYFGAYLAMFNRDLSRLKDWHARMNYCPLGAGALAGSNLPLDRQWTAEQLGFSDIIENTIDAVSDRDYVIEFQSISSIIMMHLSRLAEDLIIWSSQEFNLVKLDDAFATGSSLMPNKKNPDVLELIRGKTGRVYGNLMGILTVMKSLPLTYNKDMQEDKEGLFDSVNTLLACLEIVPPFLNSLVFNVGLMKERASAPYLQATKLVESLVLKGISFRTAHHIVGGWIKKSEEEGLSFSEIVKNEL